MTRTLLRIRKAFVRPGCWLYSQLLLLYRDDLYMRYGEEMQWVFREELKRAARSGTKDYLAVWCTVLRDTILQVGPVAIVRVGIVSIAFAGTLAIMLPVLLAVPTHFPKVEPTCMPEAHAPGTVRSLHRS